MSDRLLDLLRKTPLTDDEATELCEQFGPLANWWLTDSVQKQAAECGWEPTTSLDLPNAPGSCWIIFAREDSFANLQDSYLLPLRWKMQTGHADGLPTALRQIADDVASAVLGTKANSWSLHPADGFKRLCLPDALGLKFGSGWVSLAGGLLLGLRGLPPLAHIWASSAWERDSGPSGVGHLGQKLALADAWRLSQDWPTVQFFLSPRQQGDIALPDNVSRHWLAYPHAAERKKVDVALAPYLAALARQPTPPDHEGINREVFKAASEWYAAQLDRNRAQEFYREHLLTPIVARVIRRIKTDDPNYRPPRVCVAILSFNDELALLTPRALGVERTLLLHTADDNMSKRAEKVKDYSPKPEVVPLPFWEQDSLEMLVADFRRLLEPHLRDVSAEEVVFDVTPGDTLMKFALERVIRPWNRVVCLKVEKQADGGRPIPGQERLIFWTAT